MISIHTKSGFECERPDNVIDDVELLDLIVDLQGGKATAMSLLADKILGDQKKKLYDHIRTEDGRVPYEALNAELTEIFGQLGTAKKK